MNTNCLVLEFLKFFKSFPNHHNFVPLFHPRIFRQKPGNFVEILLRTYSPKSTIGDSPMENNKHWWIVKHLRSFCITLCRSQVRNLKVCLKNLVSIVDKYSLFDDFSFFCWCNWMKNCGFKWDARLVRCYLNIQQPWCSVFFPRI